MTRGRFLRMAAFVVMLVVFNLLGAALSGDGLSITIPISVPIMASIDCQLR